MFQHVPEKHMHSIRVLTAGGWIGLIFSLFFDPLSYYFVRPTAQWSIFHLNPALFDPSQCEAVATVQGKCIEIKSLTLGPMIFWGIVIPASILILMVLGHETWRRICPLSFLSQIPWALGKQRQRERINPRTQALYYGSVKVGKASWLGRNHLYLQFGLLYVGLCLRILSISSNRLFLGVFFALTIVSAIAIGYLYAGKSWCHFFCPMSPVQTIYTGPRGLFGSQAHQRQKQTLSQSACRVTDQEGREKSSCVGCQSPCIDIDAERAYWETLDKPGRRFVQYGYVGLVVGFYMYYALYSGNFEYYYSGVWAYEEHNLASLWDPGFYVSGYTIAIPKLVAVPLTLGTSTLVSFYLFLNLEKLYSVYRYRIHHPLNLLQIRHIFFSISTFFIFNVFFIFGGQPVLRLLPLFIRVGFNPLILFVSTLWLYRTLSRSVETYSRESHVKNLQRQMEGSVENSFYL